MKRDKMLEELRVGDLIYYMYTSGSSIQIQYAVIIGETAQRIKIVSVITGYNTKTELVEALTKKVQDYYDNGAGYTAAVTTSNVILDKEYNFRALIEYENSLIENNLKRRT